MLEELLEIWVHGGTKITVLGLHYFNFNSKSTIGYLHAQTNFSSSGSDPTEVHIQCIFSVIPDAKITGDGVNQLQIPEHVHLGYLLYGLYTMDTHSSIMHVF